MELQDILEMWIFIIKKTIVAVVKDGAGIGKNHVAPREILCYRYTSISFAKRKCFARIPILCCEKYAP